MREVFTWCGQCCDSRGNERKYFDMAVFIPFIAQAYRHFHTRCIEDLDVLKPQSGSTDM